MVTTRTQAALQDVTNQNQVIVEENGKKRARVEGEFPLRSFELLGLTCIVSS